MTRQMTDWIVQELEDPQYISGIRKSFLYSEETRQEAAKGLLGAFIDDLEWYNPYGKAGKYKKEWTSMEWANKKDLFTTLVDNMPIHLQGKEENPGQQENIEGKDSPVVGKIGNADHQDLCDQLVPKSAIEEKEDGKKGYSKAEEEVYKNLANQEKTLNNLDPLLNHQDLSEQVFPKLKQKKKKKDKKWERKQLSLRLEISKEEKVIEPLKGKDDSEKKRPEMGKEIQTRSIMMVEWEGLIVQGEKIYSQRGYKEDSISEQGCYYVEMGEGEQYQGQANYQEVDGTLVEWKCSRDIHGGKKGHVDQNRLFLDSIPCSGYYCQSHYQPGLTVSVIETDLRKRVIFLPFGETHQERKAQMQQKGILNVKKEKLLFEGDIITREDWESSILVECSNKSTLLPKGWQTPYERVKSKSLGLFQSVKNGKLRAEYRWKEAQGALQGESFDMVWELGGGDSSIGKYFAQEYKVPYYNKEKATPWPKSTKGRKLIMAYEVLYHCEHFKDLKKLLQIAGPQVVILIREHDMGSIRKSDHAFMRWLHYSWGDQTQLYLRQRDSYKLPFYQWEEYPVNYRVELRNWLLKGVPIDTS